MNLKDDDQTLTVYDDAAPIGKWGVVNVESGESQICGDMIGRTVKVREPDGKVSLKREWLPDNAKEITGFDP